MRIPASLSLGALVEASSPFATTLRSPINFSIMTRLRLSSLGALCIALAACSSDSTAPQGPYGTFSVTADATGPYPAPAPTVQVAPSGITVDGWIDTPAPCYTVTGSASVAHDTLVARVVAQKGAGTCATVIQPWKYVLSASGVPTTVTAVRVVHDSGNGTGVTVLEQAITQP